MEPSLSPPEELGRLHMRVITDEMTEDQIRAYFTEKFGEVTELVLLTDRDTGKRRGYGFVKLSDPGLADAALKEKWHVIAGKKVEVNRARRTYHQCNHQNWNYPSPLHQYLPPSLCGISSMTNHMSNNQSNNGNPTQAKKVFVGGLPPTITEVEFRSYFEQFGKIVDAVIMYDKVSRRPRGFGFVTFDSVEAVTGVLRSKFHTLSDKSVEVKFAVPRERNDQGTPENNSDNYLARRMGGEKDYANYYQNGGYYPYFFPTYAPTFSGYTYGISFPNYYGMGHGNSFYNPTALYNGVSTYVNSNGVYNSSGALSLGNGVVNHGNSEEEDAANSSGSLSQSNGVVNHGNSGEDTDNSDIAKFNGILDYNGDDAAIIEANGTLDAQIVETDAMLNQANEANDDAHTGKINGCLTHVVDSLCITENKKSDVSTAP